MPMYFVVMKMHLCSLQKATRKTDKVRPEEINVTELTDEGLKDLLLKYGLNAGPIVGKTLLTPKQKTSFAHTNKEFTNKEVI